MSDQKQLTHIAGMFVIQADGAFLNGAGLGQGEDRTTTVPKRLFDGKSLIPYVSSQAWRRWLRNTLIGETGWEPSEIRAIKFNAKGNTSKVAGQVNPIDFAEDDLFGYMRTSAEEAEQSAEDDEAENPEDATSQEAPATRSARVKSVMRPSPFASSLLVGIRRANSRTKDDGTVFPTNGTPLRYSTEFYVANMQAVFCLDYSRLGVFRNVGDRIELAEEYIKPNLDKKAIQVVEELGDKGRIYAVTDPTQRKTRTTALLNALAVLRGGAKQAQFGNPVAPQLIIAAGLMGGNPIFHHLCSDDPERGIELKIDVLKEIANDYADRIVTPIYIGVRKGYLQNEEDVQALAQETGNVKFVVTTPREAMAQLTEALP